MTSRPIRWALWILALAALAVALALAGRYGSGYVVFVVPPWRAEMSVMLFVMLQIFLFAAAYLLIQLAVKTYRLPRQLRKSKIENARAKSRDLVLESMQLLFSGEFREAEARARSAMQHDDTRDMASAIAAWAAYEGGNSGAAVPYLDHIRGEGSAQMRDASKAYMLLADGKSAEALSLLKDLAADDPKNPGVLKMKVEAEVAGKAWEDVLVTLAPLTRSGMLPEGAAQQIRLNAELNLIKSKPANPEAITEAWKAFSRESRFDATMAATVASRLLALGCGREAKVVIEETIDARGAEGWDSALAAIYADCKTDATLVQIERAERWLRQHARDAVLLATLGKLCMRQALWGKAQSYLEASVALEPTLDAHMTLARLMEQLGRSDEAARHVRRSAELAK
jgi:HemY protein